ncbi:MAG: twin-arginine translocation signal domain-containing protein, partial [Burkholderiales bacterium]
MSHIQNVSRRDFIKGTAAAGGLVVGLEMLPVAKTGPFSGLGMANAAEGVPSGSGTLSPNVFVSIDKSGTV